MSTVRLKHLWLHMIDACKKARHPDYSLLGGQDVTVCATWWNDCPASTIDCIR